MLPNWLYGKSKSKLASILGVPTDYAEVKAQVTQNAEGIEKLTDDVYGHNLNKYYIYDHADTTLFNAALNTKTLDQIIAELAAPARICICTASADLTSTLALDLIDKGLLDSTGYMFWLEISKLGSYQNRAYARCTYLSEWTNAVEKIAFVNNGTWKASKTLTN